MYEELVKQLRELPHLLFVQLGGYENIVYQAADAIESTSKAYQMMADAYESEVTKHCWIPVTERLPDNIDEEVLVSTEDYGKSGLGFVTVAVYDGNDWLECWERKTYLTAVTHWMPLPSAPTEE